MNGKLRHQPAPLWAGDQPESWRPEQMAEALPRWLPRVALAESCSAEVLVVAAASARADLPPDAAPAVLALMDTAGLLLEAADDKLPGVRVLRPEARTAMLAQVARTQPGTTGVRRELVAAGLAKPSRGLGVQLANWALDAADWDGLEAVWKLHSPRDLFVDPRVRAAYAGSPSELRARLPGLSFAAALTSAYDAEAGRVDLDQMTAALIRDGRSLHAQWPGKDTADAQVIGGTMWMLAQAAVPAAMADSRLEGPLATYAELGRVISDSSVSGSVVSSKALTFFHATAALVAILRADWPRARREGEFAMIISDRCGLPGFLAALVVASASAVSGSTQHAAVADKFLAGHAAHGCGGADWIEPAFHLVKADAAIRRLDRGLAMHHLRLHVAEGASTRWFNAQPMYATVLSAAAVLWTDPLLGLAEFDSIVADSGHEVEPGNPWGAMLLRSRAQLLLALGAVRRAGPIIDDLVAHADPSASAVPAAWFQLCSGDFARAIAKADQGIYELRISLADRAHLYALKGAALHRAGAAESLVRSAATAACLVSEQAGTLMPFAALPSGVRNHLLAEHEAHHGGIDCFVAQARRRGAFDELQDGVCVPRTLVRLTPREAVLLPLLATPATVQEIADQQFVSVNTVRKQVVSLREKLAAASRTELIQRAHELGLIDRPA